MRIPEQHEIEDKMREFEARIADGEKAKLEKAQLEEWLKISAALFPTGDGKPKASGAHSKFKRERVRLNPLASYAEAILTKDGALHINVLMGKMREAGWISTNDDRVDMKNVNSSLSANKKFVNLGRNTWDLKGRYPD